MGRKMSVQSCFESLSFQVAVKSCSVKRTSPVGNHEEFKFEQEPIGNEQFYVINNCEESTKTTQLST